MSKIVIVGCTKTKKKYPCSAYEMYSASTLFRKTVEYVKKQYDCPIVILSGKLGVLDLDQQISPYVFDPNKLQRDKRSRYYTDLSNKIHEDLSNYNDIVVFAGKNYVDIISISCPQSTIIEPLKGMGIGERLRFLTEQQTKDQRLLDEEDWKMSVGAAIYESNKGKNE